MSTPERGTHEKETERAAASNGGGIGRRAVLQTLVGGVGAAVTLPVAEAHPIHRHLGDQSVVAQADQKATAAAYEPVFLDAHQLETLEVMAERIVPRSTEARVAPFVDQLLSVDSSETQQRFLSALGAFDMLARNRHGAPWKALTATQQDELLTGASTAESGRTPAVGAGDPRRPWPTASLSRVTIRDQFENLKGWISGAYYSSEIGMRELGWTGEMFFQSLPECTHPGGHSG